MRYLLIAAALFCVSINSRAQTPVPAEKQLKPEITLQLRTLQYENAKLFAQIQPLQLLQQQLRDAFMLRLASALKDSDINPDKFVVDPETLVVSEKPKKAEPQEPETPAVSKQ